MNHYNFCYLYAIFTITIIQISILLISQLFSIFLDKINTGGLALLNELVVDTSGAEIIEVMKLATNPNNFPIALYCTAGR
jgi:LEA14-like dessication related protein